MDNKKRIERLRTEALFQRVQFSRLLLASELEEAAARSRRGSRRWNTD